MVKPVIIGCGTGRCGTQTLAKILNDCDYQHCTHERAPSMTWIFDEELYQTRLEDFKRSHTHGDIALQYLPYLERFIEDLEKVKIVVLKRDRKEVIRSFDAKTKNPDKWKAREKEWNSYFHIGKLPKKEFIGKYYDLYYKEIDKLIKKYPKHIKLFETEDLNSNQDAIYKWCEILEKDRNYKYNPRYNTIEDHIAYEKKYGQENLGTNSDNKGTGRTKTSKGKSSQAGV